MELNAVTEETLMEPESGSPVSHNRSKGVGRCLAWSKVSCSLGLFVFFAGLVGMCSNALRYYINSQISTIEKQFGLSSLKSGSLKGAYNAGFLFFVILGSHFGAETNRPRVIGFTVMLLGVGGMIAALPHLLPVPENFGNVGENSSHAGAFVFSSNLLCHNTSNEKQLISDVKTNTVESSDMGGPRNVEPRYSYQTAAMGILVTAFFIQGVAISPRSPLLLSFVDDNATTHSAGFYVGLIWFMLLLGSLLSFVLGGLFNRVYVDLYDPGFGLKDSRWIGAWWLGYLVFGVCTFLSGLLFLWLGKDSKSTRNSASRTPRSSKPMCQRLVGVFPALKRLARNRVFCCVVFHRLIDAFGFAGKLLFISKYIEIQFDLPVWKSSVIVGFTSSAVANVSVLVGGAIVSKLRLNTLGLVKMIMLCSTLTALAYIVLPAMACSTIRPEFGDPSDRADRNSSCFEACNCETTNYPVCGTDGVDYMSPCSAGCTTVTNKSFHNCSCIGHNRNGSAYSGVCEKQDCSVLVPFLVVLASSALFKVLGVVAFRLLVVRCVDKRDKSVAYGTMSFFKVALGDLPSGPVFGFVIDTTCSLFSETGACALYDKRQLRLSYIGLLAAIRVAALLLIILVYFLQRKREHQTRDKMQKEEAT